MKRLRRLPAGIAASLLIANLAAAPTAHAASAGTPDPTFGIGGKRITILSYGGLVGRAKSFGA